ncbi:aryl carrier-like protein [Kitasatospora sp. MAP12-15]|uniref:condensation domain-containing protein n=1 Tax=unclassified Kitasatospora TaxID=2633591 RepID=UPI002473F49F|nr:condensation domain-containing protein [Kitasatospora sp. MAP12-44]MDH6112900.1 aryl carrier-like protein [Kitasatospora sp. MAP12-44]
MWYEANPAQKGLWVLDQIEHLRPTSLVPTVMEFTGPVDHGLLVSAVQRVLDRHPALRSRFRLDVRHRRIEYRTDESPAEAGFIDAAAEGWSAEELTRLVDVLCYTPFQLGDEPPARAEVIRIGEGSTLLVLTVHHIVCDGWSRSLLMAEVATVYRALAAGSEPVLSSPPHPSEVVTMLAADELDERLPDAVERLRGAPIEVEVPFRRETGDTSLAGASQVARFDEELTEALLAAAGAEGCTPFMTGVALLAGTLARTGGQRDFLFAFGWPGRDDPAVAEAIGMFMNTVMIRVALDDTTTWRELLRTARFGAMEAFIDGDVPLDAVTAALKPERDVIWPPLSAVLVNMAEVPQDMELAPGVTGRLQPLPSLHMKYDLGLFVCLAEEAGRSRLELSVDYTKALYDQDAVSGFLADLRRSAIALSQFPEETVIDSSTTDVDLSTPEARLELVRSLWLEVLKADEVADDVSFFDVGGDSLLLIVLVERMTQASGRAIKTMDMFRAGTVRGHAELLATQAGAATSRSTTSARDRLLGAARATSQG